MSKRRDHSNSRSRSKEENGKPRQKAWPLIKRFWQWVRPHQRYVWCTIAMMIVSAPLSLVSPLIIRRVVDDAVENQSRDDVFFFGGLLFALTLLSVIAGLAIGYATTLLHTKVLRDVRFAIYRHVQVLSSRWHATRETGWLMSRQVDDVGNLNGVMADAFAKGAVDVIRAVGYVIMLFVIEWRMAGGGLILALLIFGFEWAISGRLREKTKASREAWTQVSRALHQGISGHALVRGTSSEKRETRIFAHEVHKSVRADVDKSMFTLITNHIFGLIGGVAPALIVLAGVWLIVTTDFTVGGLFAFFMYLVGMFGAVSSVARLNPSMQSSLASLERIYELLDEKPEIESPANPIPIPEIRGEVKLESVNFEYDAGRPILIDIDLTLPARNTVALVGPSGAGKTTLAHLLPRLFDPTSGTITLDGINLRDLDLTAFRRQVGFVPQEVFLFDRTVRENLAYGAPYSSDEEVIAAAKAANAHEFITALEDGYNTAIGERGVRLSGGQRQRLAIAREILRDPALLILDEATSALDSETEALIQEALSHLLVGRTSLVIAHRLSTIQSADLIVALDKGRIVEQGNHESLLAKNGLYARLHRSQFRKPQGVYPEDS